MAFLGRPGKVVACPRLSPTFPTFRSARRSSTRSTRSPLSLSTCFTEAKRSQIALARLSQYHQVMAQVGLLVTWQELTGTAPTMAMLEKRLAHFRLNAVLLGIARIAALLKTWENAPHFATDRLLAGRLLPTYYPDIERICESGSNRVIFTRLNLLYVAKQACRVCPLEGRNIDSADDFEGILSCCLLANDLILERVPTPTDATIDKATNLLPFGNYVPPELCTGSA